MDRTIKGIMGWAGIYKVLWDGQGYKEDYTGYYGMERTIQGIMGWIIDRTIQGIIGCTGIYRVLWDGHGYTQDYTGYFGIDRDSATVELKRVLWDRYCSCETTGYMGWILLLVK